MRNEAARQERDVRVHGGHIAYDVLRCVADTEESYVWFGGHTADILRETLNFNQSDTSLEQRREQLRKELRRSGDAYEDLEERAYQQLAGHLLSLEVAPCVYDEPVPRTLAVILDHWREVADLEAVRLLEMGFLRLIHSRNHEEALVEAGRILESIPRGVHFADVELGTEGLDQAARLVRLVIAICKQYFAHWLRERKVRGTDMLRQWDIEQYFSEMESMRFEANDMAHKHLAAERWQADGGYGDEMSSEYLEIIERDLEAALLVLAQILWELESDDEWEKILPDGGPGTRRTPVEPLPAPLS